MKKLIALAFYILCLVSCLQKEDIKHKNKILFIVSNANYYGDSEIKTYNHFAEIILPFDEFTNVGFTVDFVSPKGGNIPIGYIDESNTTHKRYLSNETFLERLKTTKTPKEINASDYAAVYYVGGGAAMFGVPENKDIQNIVMSVYEKNKGIVSALCHGSAGLVHLKTKDGKYLVSGKQVNGFPDKFERMEDDYYATFPFSIEQKLKDNGGNFKYSEKGWDDYSVIDGRLITGQDPTAARSVAKAIIVELNKTN